MKAIFIAALVVSLGLAVLSQEPATTLQTPPPAGNTPAGRQNNAASATQDTSGTTGDQITHPPGAKGSTLIGCLVGPDKDGKYMLRNMAHRFGVQVMGPEDFKNDSGSKVKLTGDWQPLPPQESNSKSGETRRFQATDVEVVSANCKPPGETTPVSKKKEGKATTYNAPSTDDSTPK